MEHAAKRRSTTPFLPVALCLAVMGWGLPRAADTGEADEASLLFADKAGRIQVGEPALPLELSGLLQAPAGASADWPALRGNVVVLEFWATWCAPCITAIPHMNDLAERFEGEPIRFISITDEKRSVVERFLEQKAMRSWIGLDADGRTTAAYGAQDVMPLPVTFVIDKAGEVAAITVPAMLDERLLRELLDGEPPPRATLFELRIKPSSGRPHRSSRALGRFTADSVDARWMLTVIHDVSDWQIVDEAGLDDRRYDVVVATPRGQASTDSLLRTAVESTFGIRTRRETREVESLELRPAGRGLGPNFRPSSSEGPSTSYWKGNELGMTRRPVSSVADVLESLLGRRVASQVELEGLYDWKLTYEDRNPETIITAVREQLGFDLVPVRAEIDFVIVEKDGE